MGRQTRTDRRKKVREPTRSDDRRLARGAIAPVLLLTLTAALAIGGCGNLTAGGARGEVSAAVSGDASEPAQAAPAPTAAVIEGTVDATVRVYLENDAGDRFPVVGSDTRAALDVQGETEVEMGSVELELGTYPRARIVFTDVFAVIESGLTLGDVIVEGRIDVGDETVDSIVVERAVGIQLEEDAEQQILVDLNSPTWLALADPVLGIVAADDFASAVDVRVR